MEMGGESEGEWVGIKWKWVQNQRGNGWGLNGNGCGIRGGMGGDEMEMGAELEGEWVGIKQKWVRNQRGNGWGLILPLKWKWVRNQKGNEWGLNGNGKVNPSVLPYPWASGILPALNYKWHKYAKVVF